MTRQTAGVRTGRSALRLVRQRRRRPVRALLTDLDITAELRAAKAGSMRQLGNALSQWLPRRLAEIWLAVQGLPSARSIAELRDRELDGLAETLSRWTITPNGSEGFRNAEVTIDGVDTRELDSRDLQSKRIAGLHFIGEVVDVTG